MKKKKLVYGIGVNDADYVIQPTINGKRQMCYFFQAWHSMIARCYDQKFLAKRPTYIGCSVVDDWLTFSNFKNWMETQDWQGKQLDKDIMHPGNKIYGPETCVFVTGEINKMVVNQESKRGAYPVGVCFVNRDSIFKAQIKKYGENKYIGSFATQEAASASYVSEKVAHIIDVASTQSPKIKAGLLKHAAILEAHHA